MQNFIQRKGKKVKAVDLYSASSCTPKAGGQNLVIN